MLPILGCWDFRGSANPIRLFLAQACVKYEEKRYTCGGPPDFDKSSWLKDKFTLGLESPSLPYYIDDDVKLTKTDEIMRYLARKRGYDGDDEIEMAHIELVAAKVYDYFGNHLRLVYNPDFKNLRADYTKTVPDNMKALSDFLGSKNFISSSSVQYVDFLVFEYLEVEENLTPGVLERFRNLYYYHRRIANFPVLSHYLASPEAIKSPFNGPKALFGGKFSDQLCK